MLKSSEGLAALVAVSQEQRIMLYKSNNNNSNNLF